MQKLLFRASEEDAGLRMDLFLCARSELSRSMIHKLCMDGLIKANGKPVKKNYRLQGSELLELVVPPLRELDVVPQNIPLEIVYEDDALLVVNKPKGMVVHPAPGHPDGTLVNALLYHCNGRLSGIGGMIRPGIVHRIDRDTSGLLVVAKTDAAHFGLSEQVRAHSFTRIYRAVCYGKFQEQNGVIDAPIGRHPADRKKMCVTDIASRSAVTHYRTLMVYGGFSDLELQLETGRTHQIRVHLSHLGHPVAGDPVYGPKKVIAKLFGQCLHANSLGFSHPISGKEMNFTAGLPGWYLSFLSGLQPA